MRLAVKPDVDLPTMPTIRVYAVIGFPKVAEHKKMTGPLILSHCRRLAPPWGGLIMPPSFLCRNQNTPSPFTSRWSFTFVHLDILSFFRMIYQKRLLAKGQGGWPTQTGDKFKVGGILVALRQAAPRMVGVDYNGWRAATSGGSHLWRVHLWLPRTWKRRGAQWKCWKWKVRNNKFEVTRYTWISFHKLME